MKHLKLYKTFESNSLEETHKETIKDVEMMMGDMLDYNWKYTVKGDFYMNTKSIIKSLRDNDRNPKSHILAYSIKVEVVGSEVDIEVVRERLNQIGEIITPYKLNNVIIHPNHPPTTHRDTRKGYVPILCYSQNYPESKKEFRDFNDYSISQLLSSGLETDKELYDFVHNSLFTIYEPGMGEWMGDFLYSHRSGDDFKFISNLQFDDTVLVVGLDDLDTDVKLDVKKIEAQFIYKL